MKLEKPASVFMLFLLVFWLIVQFGIGVVIYVAYELGNPINIMDHLWVMALVQLSGLLLPLFLWLIITKDSFKRNMPNKPLGVTNFVLLVIMSFLMIPAVMLISAISSLFVTNDVAVLLQSLNAQPWWLMMLVFAVVPGVVEELVFRGYIQSNTRGCIAKVAILNGFLFAIMHLNPHQFVYTFVLGVIFAYMVYHTKSIWAGIIPHFLINGINVMLSHWAMGAVSNGYEYAADEPTLAQHLYEIFAPTNPDFAQRAYEWAYNVNIDLLLIGVLGIFAVFTTAGFAGVFVAFVSHNRKRSKESEALQEEVPQQEEAMQLETGEPPKRFKMDWWLAAVVVIYLLVVVTPFFISS